MQWIDLHTSCKHSGSRATPNTRGIDLLKGVPGPNTRVKASGFRVKGSGFRVKGSGFWV